MTWRLSGPTVSRLPCHRRSAKKDGSTMKNFLVVVVIVLAGVAAFGFYRGWFRVSTGDAEHKTDVTFTVDKDKLAEDEKKLKDAGGARKKPSDGQTTPEPERRP
jgi:hypothetical protein